MTDGLPTIVVVDDAADVRLLVKTRLRLSGRFVIVAEGATGVDAVALAEEHRPALMLLDVSMPQMDGLEALPRVLQVSPATRVVLYSGFDEAGLAERARTLGAAAFIEKSTSIDRLADDLAAVLVRQPGEAPVVRSRRSPVPAQQAALPEGDAEPVLAKHLERFHEVFEEAAIGMATLTLTGQIVRANKALGALFGRTPAGLVGMPYADVAPSAKSDFAAAVDQLVCAESDIVHVEHAMDSPAGERHVRTTVSAVRGDERQSLYLFLQAQDTTEQRRAEEDLRQSEERFRLLVEAVEDYAIFMLDPDGRVASWNAGAQRIKGYSIDDVTGRHFRLFYPPEKQRERHPERELELALRDGHYEEEGWRIRKDGSRFWANVVLTAVHNRDGKHVGFAKVTRDITERQRALEQREQATAALAAANDELEAMNAKLSQAADDQAQFLAVTAHELRGPVAVLGGSADTLARHWSALTDEERHDLFDGMVSSATRLRRLLGDLLMAARLEAGAVQLDRRVIRLADVLAPMAATVARRSDLVFVDCPADVEVLADRDRLAQAVENLVRNALEHGAPPVHVVASGTADGVEIRVSDEGPGVSPEMQRGLFERFSTGEQVGGTGLGLFIVRELARAHGGDAYYDAVGSPHSNPAFVLSLPAR